MVNLVLEVCHIDLLGLARCDKTHHFMGHLIMSLEVV